MAVPSYRDTLHRFMRKPMRKTFTFLGITLILITIMLMGAIRPTMKKISELQGEINSRTEVNEKLQTKIENLQKLQLLYESEEEKLETLDVFFPSNTDYSLIMASLEKITQHYGYTMRSLSIKKTDNPSTEYPLMEKVQMNLVLEGRKSNLVRLVKHLESLPIVPSVDNVTYTPESGDEDDAELDVSIRVHMYKTI